MKLTCRMKMEAIVYLAEGLNTTTASVIMTAGQTQDNLSSSYDEALSTTSRSDSIQEQMDHMATIHKRRYESRMV